MSMYTFAVVNQKGGVGKSMSSFNIAAALATRCKRVLLVDFDPQATLTIMTGLSPIDYEGKNITHAIQTVLGGKATKDQIRSCIHSVPTVTNLYILPASLSLSAVELQIISATAREHILKRLLHGVEDDYDYCFIDCSPSLGTLTLNALTAANSVIIPCVPEYASLYGVEALLDTIETISEMTNPQIKIAGILISMNAQTEENIIQIAKLKEKFTIIGQIKKSESAKKEKFRGVPYAGSNPSSDTGRHNKAEFLYIADKIMEGEIR